MSTPANPDATEVHPPAPKIFNGTRASVERRNLDDPDVVAALARDIVRGGSWRATMVTAQEIRALALLIVETYPVAKASAELFVASHASGSANDAHAALLRLKDATLPLLEFQP